MYMCIQICLSLAISLSVSLCVFSTTLLIDSVTNIHISISQPPKKIVVWGFTKAPIPLVAALRETSIFFSIFIGYFFLKETINLKKIISIVLIVIGVIGIKLF